MTALHKISRRVCLAALAISCAAVPAQAEKLALMIANGEYALLNDLPNTYHDINSYAEAFHAMGYAAEIASDLDHGSMAAVLSAFVDRIRPGDDVVFVYAGHGWSDGLINYLIPTDAEVETEAAALARRSVALKDGRAGILDRIAEAGATLSVAIIDACRNNPYRFGGRNKSMGVHKGLTTLNPPSGSYVVFSAGAGQFALENLHSDKPDQKLSVFTRNFVDWLRPGTYLQDAFRAGQRLTVEAASEVGHVQTPAAYDETDQLVCLSGDCDRQAPTPPESPVAVRIGEALQVTARATDLKQCDPVEFEVATTEPCLLDVIYPDSRSGRYFRLSVESIGAPVLTPSERRRIPQDTSRRLIAHTPSDGVDIAINCYPGLTRLADLKGRILPTMDEVGRAVHKNFAEVVVDSARVTQADDDGIPLPHLATLRFRIAADPLALTPQGQCKN